MKKNKYQRRIKFFRFMCILILICTVVTLIIPNLL